MHVCVALDVHYTRARVYMYVCLEYTFCIDMLLWQKPCDLCKSSMYTNDSIRPHDCCMTTCIFWDDCFGTSLYGTARGHAHFSHAPQYVYMSVLIKCV